MKETVTRRLIAAALAAVITAALGLGLSFVGDRLVLSPAQRAAAGLKLLPANETDVCALTTGIPQDTVLFTVDGVDVTAEEYLYWLGSMTSYFETSYRYSGMTLDFEAEVEPGGVTWDEQLREVAYQNAALLALTPGLAKEYGASLSEEDMETLVLGHGSDVDAAGGEAGYAYQLQAMGINDATAFAMDQTMTLFSKAQQAYLTQTAAALTGDEVAAFAEENDVLRAKHILLLSGEDEAAKADRRAEAEELLAQLRTDPDQFDALMLEHSEDTGLAANPDGYLFTAGQFVSAFEEATRALEYGQISDIVESDYGYHIIRRLDPDCDELRQSLAGERFGEFVQARVDSATVVKSPEYDSISAAQYYTALLDFQANLAQPDVRDQSGAQMETPAP